MDSLLPDSQVLDIVEHIYAAGCDPAEWRSLARRMHDALPGICFGIHVHLEGTSLAENCAVAGFAEEHLASYFEHYQFINPYIPLFAKMPIGKVHTIGETVDRAWIKLQPFYNEWLKPAGNLTHAAGVVVLRDDQRMLRITLDIPERLGAAEIPAARLLERLTPHLARAFMLNETFAAATADRTALAALVETMDASAVIVDGTGKIVFLNAKAEATLRSGRLARASADHRLAFSDTAHDTEYRRLLASVSDPASSDGRTSFRAGAVDEPATHVIVLPLRAPSAIGMAPVAGWALVVLRDSATSNAPPEHMLRTLYRMTPAEARIAIDLARGHTADEIAARNGVSKLTVRNQIAAAMAKVEVSRQAQLVSAVSSVIPRLGCNTAAED
ncbi:MAG: helix-turn-helix transcriptional regulator [Hyphomicrobium sp.]|uniref:helix-turn-helix transcriptional regulator n=1 Tax=Hyphomicrobium sp. TaxID=82 RepID=UPI003D12E097